MTSIKAEGLLLYIDQPLIKLPERKMQMEYHTSMNDENKQEKKQKKSFKKYTIAEKINYLIHLPKGLPSLKCEVKVRNTDYRGWLVRENEEFIWLRSFQRREEQIHKKDILDIHLIS